MNYLFGSATRVLLARALALLVTLAGCALPRIAAADTILCPEPIGSHSRQYSVDPADVCLAYGMGNIGQGNAAHDGFLQSDTGGSITFQNLGWTLIEKVPEGSGIGAGDFLETTGPVAGPGEFFINPSVWDVWAQIALGLKGGGDPQWADFVLPHGTLTGGWDVFGDVNDDQGSLSHAVLYGRLQSIPEPATLLLLGGGLAVTVVRRRRTRTRASR